MQKEEIRKSQKQKKNNEQLNYFYFFLTYKLLFLNLYFSHLKLINMSCETKKILKSLYINH